MEVSSSDHQRRTINSMIAGAILSTLSAIAITIHSNDWATDVAAAILVTVCAARLMHLKADENVDLQGRAAFWLAVIHMCALSTWAAAAVWIRSDLVNAVALMTVTLYTFGVLARNFLEERLVRFQAFGAFVPASLSLFAMGYFVEPWYYMPALMLLLGSWTIVTLSKQTRQFVLDLVAREREHLATAMTDPLTKLPNRLAVERRIDELIMEDAEFSVLFIDIDRFKSVNDTHGHQVGDELLRQISRRLTASTKGEADLIGRLSGDEFVIVLRSDRAKAETIGKLIVGAMSTPFPIGEARIDSGASIGIASCPGDGRTRTEIMRRADTALYAAKRSGRGTCHVYGEAFDLFSRAA